MKFCREIWVHGQISAQGYTCSSTSTKGLHFAALSFAVFSNDHVLKAFNSCIDKDAGR